MLIKQLILGPIQANCYILGCPDTKKAAVIDPGDEADKILSALADENLTLEAIINTHGHFDHVGANKRLKEATNAPLMIHPLDAPMLSHLASNASAWGLSSENSPPPDRELNDGDSVRFGEIEMKVLHTPGHTPGGISLHTNAHVFVGDTLFAGSIGRTDLSGGNHETLIESIHNKLFKLNDTTKVMPGHMGPTTIGEEKNSNPFCALR